MIYITNRDSGTLSIFDDSTNNLTAGVSFNVEPVNAGNINCGSIRALHLRGGP